MLYRRYLADGVLREYPTVPTEAHTVSRAACVAVGFVRDQRCTRNWSQLALPMHEYPRVPHNHTEYTAQVLLRALALCFGEMFVMGAPPAAEVKLKPAGTAAAAARKRKLDSKRTRLVRLHTVACTISKMPSAQRSLSRALPSALPRARRNSRSRSAHQAR